MKFLWLSWKDISHPLAGGAEVVLHELSKRMVQEGHEVTILTARYKGSKMFDTIDGIDIIRVGSNRYIHSFAALWYYIRNLRNKYDVVIEAVNTAPYFSFLGKDSAKRLLFYHQLAREIWYLEAPFPVSMVGYYVLEPIATFVLGKSKTDAITISESTKRDLMRFGFSEQRIHIISEGSVLAPAAEIDSIQKYNAPTLLSLGAMREMKQTLEQLKAFEQAKEQMPELRMKIAGDYSSDYGKKVLSYIEKSAYRDDIEVLGRITHKQKMELMQRCHVIGVTSIKEGWGLIVTEANSQGTPAVVYDVDGLRDSVRHGKTGIVTSPDPQALADGIVSLVRDQKQYNKMRHAGWQWSKAITFEQSLSDLNRVLEEI